MRGKPLLLVYVLEDNGPWQPGAALRYWLHHSLAALDADLQRVGHGLLLLRGDAVPLLGELLGKPVSRWVQCHAISTGCLSVAVIASG